MSELFDDFEKNSKKIFFLVLVLKIVVSLQR